MRRSLAIAAVLAALTAVPCAWAATDGLGGGGDLFNTDTLVGESVGENLYEKIDEGGYAAESGFYAQALEGSARELNALLKDRPTLLARLCAGQTEDCRVFVRNVDVAMVQEALVNGTLGGLLKALNPAVAARITTADANELFLLFSEYARKKQAAVAEASQQAQSLSLIGLYVDGDLDNSDYDIVSDVEKINVRLFSKAPEYEGPINRSRDAAGDLVSGPFQGGANVERPSGGADAASSTGFAYKDAAARACPAPAWAGGLVDEVNALLAPQGRDGEDGWDAADPLAGAGLSTSTQLAKPNLKGDCGDKIFCVNIEFLTYQQKLLGYGGRAKSVENVVDKHLAHVEGQSGKSFLQSNHATNFTQLGIAGNLKRLLVDNLSFKVEVNMLPPPFLASKGLPKEEPAPAGTTAAAAAAGGDLSLANLVMQAMKAEGLGANPDRFNLIFVEKDDLARRQQVAKSEGGDVAAAAVSLGTVDADAQAAAQAKGAQEVAAQVYVSDLSAQKLNANLLEISTFTSSFRQSVETLTTVISAMSKRK